MAGKKTLAQSDVRTNVIAERMLHLRRAYGLSRRQVEELSGGRISAHSLFSYETGRRRPKLGTLLNLADFYGVSMGYFLNDGCGGVLFMGTAAGRQLAGLVSRPEFIGLLNRLSRLPPLLQQRVLESWSAMIDLAAPEKREPPPLRRTALPNNGDEGHPWEKNS